MVGALGPCWKEKEAVPVRVHKAQGRLHPEALDRVVQPLFSGDLLEPGGRVGRQLSPITCTSSCGPHDSGPHRLSCSGSSPPVCPPCLSDPDGFWPSHPHGPSCDMATPCLQSGVHCPRRWLCCLSVFYMRAHTHPLAQLKTNPPAHHQPA